LAGSAWRALPIHSQTSATDAPPVGVARAGHDPVGRWCHRDVDGLAGSRRLRGSGGRKRPPPTTAERHPTSRSKRAAVGTQPAKAVRPAIPEVKLPGARPGPEHCPLCELGVPGSEDPGEHLRSAVRVVATGDCRGTAMPGLSPAPGRSQLLRHSPPAPEHVPRLTRCVLPPRPHVRSDFVTELGSSLSAIDNSGRAASSRSRRRTDVRSIRTA